MYDEVRTVSHSWVNVAVVVVKSATYKTVSIYHILYARPTGFRYISPS
jgi:hypothetical protein